MNVITIAQLVTSITNILFVGVLALGYYYTVKASRDTLSEMHAQRVAGGRPQIIVEADYTRMPLVDIVVRNTGGGPAKDIRFGFSAPVESSTGFVVSKLRYFEEGMDFLGAGREIRSFWDNFNDLVTTLRDKGLEDGITVSVSYRDLNGVAYQDMWVFNPLLYEGDRSVSGYRGMDDLVGALEKISDDLKEIKGYLRTASESETPSAQPDRES